MEWGMQNRLNRLMPNGRCFFMPIDHGYFQGPTTGLEKPGETIKPLLPYVDAVFCTRGVLRSAIDPAIDKPVILRVSGGTSMVGKVVPRADTVGVWVSVAAEVVTDQRALL